MIGHLFRTPSSFEGDPRGFALNQLGHSIIGAVAAALALHISPWAAWLPLALYVVWEALQWRLYHAPAWDCVEDVGFFAVGMCAILVHPVAGAIGAVFLLAGYLRRFPA